MSVLLNKPGIPQLNYTDVLLYSQAPTFTCSHDDIESEQPLLEAFQCQCQPECHATASLFISAAVQCKFAALDPIEIWLLPATRPVTRAQTRRVFAAA